MSSCFRPSRVRPIFRSLPSSNPHSARAFSCTCRVRQEKPAEATVNQQDPEESAPAAVFTEERSNEYEQTYDSWMDAEGFKWKDPDPLGPKWIGGDVPFPLNLTFKPPTPVSDALRTTIYMSYLNNSQENDIHTLSTRYGIAAKRIEAIIRLKDLEEQWKKSKPLQTGFLKGMERILGLNRGGRMTAVIDEIGSQDRVEVNAADEVSRQATEKGPTRKRGISRTFFEPVDEDKEPFIPSLLDEVRDKSRRTQQSEYPTTVVQPDASKPAYKFVDVGLRWVDRGDMERRQKESARRKAIKDHNKRAEAVKAE